jgi:hypothetical protein
MNNSIAYKDPANDAFVSMWSENLDVMLAANWGRMYSAYVDKDRYALGHAIDDYYKDLEQRCMFHPERCILQRRGIHSVKHLNRWTSHRYLEVQGLIGPELEPAPELGISPLWLAFESAFPLEIQTESALADADQGYATCLPQRRSCDNQTRYSFFSFDNRHYLATYWSYLGQIYTGDQTRPWCAQARLHHGTPVLECGTCCPTPFGSDLPPPHDQTFLDRLSALTMCQSHVASKLKAQK